MIKAIAAEDSSVAGSVFDQVLVKGVFSTKVNVTNILPTPSLYKSLVSLLLHYSRMFKDHRAFHYTGEIIEMTDDWLLLLVPHGTSDEDSK